MKGIVFCEFLNMVDTAISPEMTEKIIESSDLPSGGVYTTVGTYAHDEIITLVSALSKETGSPVSELVKSFGLHLFGRFVELYPQFFEGVDNVFDFLDTVDAKIHVDVRKLYPEAQLPSIQCERLDEDRLELLYESGRAMGDLAEGLIESAVAHFGESIEITREDISSGAVQRVRFVLRKSGG